MLIGQSWKEHIVKQFLFLWGIGWLFHNPLQSNPALGAAYLTFTAAVRALPVLHGIKDSLAIKWNEAFE